MTVASSYGHSKVASYLREILAQNAEEKEEWDYAECEDKFCGSFTPLRVFVWQFYTAESFVWQFYTHIIGSHRITAQDLYSKIILPTKVTFMEHQNMQFYTNFWYKLLISRTAVLIRSEI